MVANLESTVLQVAAVGLRVAGVFTFMPFLGSPAIPIRLKVTLVVLLTGVVAPLVSVHLPPFSLLMFAQLALSELMLGLLMGLCLQFVLETVQLAGQIGGFQLSFSLVNVIDPQTNVETPVLADFEQLIVLLLFLQMNVHHWILRGLQDSFLRVPPGAMSFSMDHVHELFRAAGGIWISGIQLAAPLLLATLVLDVTVGFVSKAAPQLPVLFLSIPLKSMIGYIVLATAFGLWPSFFEKQFSHALSWSWHMLEIGK